MKVSAGTHVGLKRTNNEDCYILAPDVGFFAVADGVGGHQAGEVASYLACAKFVEQLRQAKIDNLGINIPLLKVMLHHVHGYIQCRAGSLEGNEPGYGMATTFTGVLLGDVSYLVHIGDSRAYRFGDIPGEGSYLHQISTDDQDDQDDWGILTDCLGLGSIQGHIVEIKPLNKGDRILLATDGLEDIKHKEVNRIVRDEKDVENAVHYLIDAALDAGGRDNVTVVLIEV